MHSYITMIGRIAKPVVRTSVVVSPEFYTLAKQHHIGFTEALRVGMSMILAEKGVKEYDNQLNIMRKMKLLRQKLEETSLELEKVKVKSGEVRPMAGTNPQN